MVSLFFLIVAFHITLVVFDRLTIHSILAPIMKKTAIGSTGKSGAGGLLGKTSGKTGHTSTAGKIGNASLSSGKSPKLSTGKTTSKIGSFGESGIPKKSSTADKLTGSFISPSSSKSYPVSSYSTPKSKSTTFGIVWLPTRKNKRKKELVYNSHKNDHYKERSPSMYHNFMENEHHKKKEEETGLLVEKKSPVVVAGASAGAAAAADLPPDINDNSDEKQEFIKRDKDNRDKEATGDTNEKKDDDYLSNDKATNTAPETKQEKDAGDKVDSVYLRPKSPHKTNRAAATTVEPQEEDCGIKCLYYTLQCCDCVLQ